VQEADHSQEIEKQKKKAGKLPVDLVKSAKIAISPVLRLFPFCFSFSRCFRSVAAGRIDTALSAEEAPPALESEVLFNLDFVCLVGSAQRVRARRFTLKQYLHFSHALVETLEGQQTFPDRALAQLGAKRGVALTLPFFVPAIFALAQTDLILTVPRKLAQMTAPIARLRVVEPPREIKAFPYFMAWHPRLTTEPAHAWFREQLRMAARIRRSVVIGKTTA
jgi:DNA-binding transcriptional LysR family regulator